MYSVANGQRLAPMESRKSSRIAAPLGHRVGADANAAQIADAVVATWQEIEAALTIIIGQRGISALYRRSLYLTDRIHPWLAGAHEGAQPHMDLAALKAVLAQQSAAVAVAGGGALLQKFHELLTSLVGPSLTERLLRSVWANSSSGQPAQDNTP